METAAGMANALVKLKAGSPDIAQRAARARQIAAENYDWRAIAGNFERRMMLGFPLADALAAE